MNKLTKNILMGIAVVGLAATTILGITYSKYTNAVSGNGETEVAKWNFKVNSETEEFATIKLADTYDASTLTNGKIAPGTKGSFFFKIYNIFNTNFSVSSSNYNFRYNLFKLYKCSFRKW